MLEALSSGTVGHVVAVKLDRLFHNVLDCVGNVEKWEKAGLCVHLLDLAVNTCTASGKAFLQMTASFAEMERNLVRERTETALAHKKANLQVYNHTPYGFNREGNALVPNSNEQATIERIKSLDDEGVPMMRIAERLNSERVPTKKGGRWYASTVKAILTNDFMEQLERKSAAVVLGWHGRQWMNQNEKRLSRTVKPFVLTFFV